MRIVPSYFILMPITSPVTAAAVLDAQRAALTYLRALKRLGHALNSTEQRALSWTLLGSGEYVEVWRRASNAEREEAGRLIADLSAILEPAGRTVRRPHAMLRGRTNQADPG
jgi:hypothetical protein